MKRWLPWLDRHGRLSPLRAICFALLLVPALWLAYDAATGALGAKPWTRAVHDTGNWAIRLLIATLAVSPLRRILNWNRLIGIRRMLGLSVLAYAMLHLTLYCIDLGFDAGLIVSEITKRFYLIVGMVAFAGLVALGVTATDGMIRRLGAMHWQRLHNFIYCIAALGLLHFALQAKIDVTEPALMAGLFGLLMLYRLLPRLHIAFDTPRLIGTGLAAALLTMLGETAWYALKTGASAWSVFEANADVVIYGDLAALRPGPCVALVGFAIALAGYWRAPAEPRRARRVALTAEAGTS